MDPRTRQAFALWTAAQPAVSAFVHALAGARALRDEVLQDTATRVLESFGNYDTTRPFLPWALTIARRALSDARRQQRRFPVALSPAAEEALAAAMSPAADAVQAQVDHLNHCIDLLRDQQRELCDLRYRAELPNGRIAELTGLNPTTVAKSLQRIREQLRECIESRTREAGDGSLASPSGGGS